VDQYRETAPVLFEPFDETMPVISEMDLEHWLNVGTNLPFHQWEYCGGISSAKTNLLMDLFGKRLLGKIKIDMSMVHSIFSCGQTQTGNLSA